LSSVNRTLSFKSVNIEKTSRSGDFIIIPGILTDKILGQTARGFLLDKGYGVALSFFGKLFHNKPHSPELDMADKLMMKAQKEGGPETRKRHFMQAYDYYEKVSPRGLVSRQHDEFDQNYAQGMELIIKPLVYPDSTTTLNEIRSFLDSQPNKQLFRDFSACSHAQRHRSLLMGEFGYSRKDGTKNELVFASRTPYLSKVSTPGIVSKQNLHANSLQKDIFLPKIWSSLVRFLPSEKEQKSMTNKLLTANENHILTLLSYEYKLKYYIATDNDYPQKGYSDSMYRISQWANPPFRGKDEPTVYRHPFDDKDFHITNIG
jgi:hypothetical protein